VRRLAELVSGCHAPRQRLIAVKLDLNMRRFRRNCDYVLTKRGDQVAQTAAWTGLPVSPRLIQIDRWKALNARRRPLGGIAFAGPYKQLAKQLAGASNNWLIALS
jgi:hypothetical protein